MNEQAIFLAALDIADPAERVAYLKRTCADDATLLRQVESLLAAHLQSGEFLDVPALKQIAAGVADDRRSPDETSAEQHGAKGEVNLSFLQPSAKPGSLGRLGHYEVQEVIGRGGFGIVLKAFDEMLHRVVAIKVLAPELAATSPARKRFLREARAAAAIRHENVVSIYSVEEQPLPYLVMEYIAGQTLQQKLDQSGPLGVREVVQIGQQIATGLKAAHAMGLIHRDIKPGNILLENGVNRVKITDFGLARTSDDASLTQSGVIAGTPLYMSPEQAKGDVIDQRSDLFSLGSVLYVMCSGRPPFRAATTVAVLMRVVEHQPRPIQQIIPEVPEWLSAIIGKLHAKKPSDRFASAQEVASLLARCLSELQQHGKVESVEDILPLTPKPASASEEIVQPVRSKIESQPVPELSRRRSMARNRRWVAAAAVIVILLAGLGMTEATGVTNLHGTVIRLFSPDGTLVVEVDDPDVSVCIDGGEMVVTGTGAREIRLKPGQYNVLASKDGKIVRQELVTITRNGRQVVRVSKETDVPMVTGGQSKAIDPDRRAAEWALSVGGTIKITLGNVRERPIEAATDLPPRFAFTTAYFYRNPTVTDVGLAHFKDCKNLTSLHLADTSATDAGLAYFKDCKNLKDLYLYGINISDAGLAHFKDCKNLTSLSIQNASVTDAGLAYFKDCKNLTSLILWNAPVSDSGLAYFKDSKSITTLDLCEIQVGDAGLAHFKDCNELTSLSLWNTQVSDSGLAHLKDCKNLTGLDLRNTNVTTAGIDALKKASPQCKIEWDGGVIEPSPTTDPDRRAAEWVLSIGGSIEITENSEERPIEAVGDLPSGAFEITTVNLVENPRVTDAGIAKLAAKSSLVTLDIGGTGISDAGIQRLGALTNLRDLGVANTQITDSGLLHLSSIKVLRAINLENTNITDAGLPLLKRLGNLLSLNLTGTHVTADGVEKLQSALPTCNITWMPTTDPDRLAAASVVSVGGTFSCNVDGKVISVSDWSQIPSASFGVTAVALQKSQEITPTNIKILSELVDVESINLSESNITDEAITFLNGLPNLKSLNLEGTAVTGAGLRQLDSLPQLGSLSLANSEVKGEELGVLSPYRLLSFLGLGRRQLTAAAGESFRRLKRPGTIVLASDVGDAECDAIAKAPLSSLGADGTRITDDGVRRLTALRNLGSISLDDTPLSNVGLGYLAEMATLQSIGIERTRISDEGLASFGSRRRNLAQLDLIGCDITDEGVRQLLVQRSLSLLWLNDTQVTDAGVGMLRELPCLSELSLNSTAITDAALADIGAIATVTWLDLDDTEVTDAGIRALRNLSKLAALGLERTRVTAAGVAELQAALPKCGIAWSTADSASVADRRAADWALGLGGTVSVLVDGEGRFVSPRDQLPEGIWRVTGMHLQEKQGITREGLSNLKGLSIRYLALDGSDVTDDALSGLRAFHRLTRLDLSATNITDVGIRNLGPMPMLGQLTMHRSAVTDIGLEELQKFGNLQILMVDGNQLTALGVANLAKLPKLTTLIVDGCNRQPAGSQVLNLPAFQAI